MQQSPSTEFYAPWSDKQDDETALSLEDAQKLWNYFKNSPLFKWHNAGNDCEDRANAICILLDAWGIPNAKGWVFSGYFMKKNYGSLIHAWNFHVATILPVIEDGGIKYYVIDPPTISSLSTIEDWALKITASDKSYHFIKHSHYYIFPSRKIEKDNWHKRNKRNYNWTIQGLSGINGVSPKGRAQLAFNKRIVKQTQAIFIKLKNEKLAGIIDKLPK